MRPPAYLIKQRVSALWPASVTASVRTLLALDP